MKKEDIVELLDILDKKYILSKKKPYIQTQCFFSWNHKRGDRTPSFSISVNENDLSYCHCFTCHHNWMKFIDAVNQLNQRSKNKYQYLVEFINKREDHSLAGRFTRSVDRAKSSCRKKTVLVEDLNVFSEDELDRFSKGYHTYASERGITQKTFQFWDMCIDEKYDRLVFPLRREEDSSLVGLTGRTLIDGTKKYYHYWNMNKSNYFFGEHLFSESVKKIVLVEGTMDVIKLWQVLGKEFLFLGILGSSLSNIQASRLRHKELPTILMFDGDKSGRDCTRIAELKLKKYLPLYKVRLPDGKDPGDLDYKQVRKYLDSAEFVY